MRKQLLFILSLFVAGTLAAQISIPDGNFEKWDSVYWNDPMFYYTSSSGMNAPIGAPVNVAQTAGFHGTYGVQMTSLKFGGDTLFGYITNSQGNPAAGQGGIPYNQQATGARFYYKCHEVATDTAGVMLVFKKSGSVIGIYFSKLYGNVKSYTLNTMNFTPPLPSAPDSVIFAAVTTITALNNGSGLPGDTLTLDSLTFTGVASQPAMQNGDFENWVQDTLLGVPGWFVTTNGSARTTDKDNGQYALQLRTDISVSNGGQPQNAYASTGRDVRINNRHDSLIVQYPYSNTVDSLVFYYKYVPALASGDSAQVSIQFNKGGSILFNDGAPIGPAAVYTRFSLPFNLGINVPDSVMVNFESSKQNGGNVNPAYVGSTLKVDSVHFGSQVLTGMPTLFTGNIQVYPNPSNGMFYVNLQGFSGSVEKITVYDMNGRAVESKLYAFGGTRNSIEQFDMSSFATGTYLVKINTSQGIKYEKVSKL